MMLTPRIWVFYDEIQNGWNWDVATTTVSYRSPRYNPYDTKMDAEIGALKAYRLMGGKLPEDMTGIVRIFSGTREYAAAQIERDKRKKEY